VVLQYQNLKQAIFIIMQDILEENSLFQNINFVPLAQMPDRNEELIHLYDFQIFLDNLILN
jgi:hypothetical protein